ncbi:penicillin-binding protein 2 [Streptosporangium becharense]|uniref:Penicillin-binding protein 2 n=1 Tax=Streptosporangium becharense TaxID=1816182 RepID=A0A7W9MIW1_9ACTN|nr:penicillin-binding protein 2 [Streptosporangium becharense]MBB2913073.1 penicillin-binding protein 2 [Streptosporangium becharense]MBB5822056.1 penicillin-binding protein 2 [Streptosporangium becharense]
MIRMRGRLVVLQVLVVSLMTLLAARLWQVQVVRGAEYVAAATETRTRDVVVPAVRGQILDSAGRPLVRNRTTLVVSVDRTRLNRMEGNGRTVLDRLAKVLGRRTAELRERIRACGPGVARPCWPGSPYQPIPIDDDVTTREALQILERQEEFPGVTAEVQAVREYPGDSAGAQALGYLQPITQEELERRDGLRAAFSGVDLVGRDGLESVYDVPLRGTPGMRRVQVDRLGKVIGVERQVPPVPGDTLITSIDAKVQAAAEKALAEAMKSAPRADGAAAVVLDARTSRVIALASAPTYDPAVWTGGISETQYQRLLSDKAGRPLVSRAIKGEFAPGSTFKVSSVAAMLRDGYPLHGKYSCPGSFMVGDRPFNNFRGIGLGTLTLHTALVKSCDTIFYRAAYEQWLRDGGLHPKGRTKEPMAAMARAFGFGRPTGIDLPGESPGRIPDRAWKKQLWSVTKDENCRRARTGYPEAARSSPSRAAFLKRLAYENCLEGYQWRPGDAANFSIGQGDVLVTPLQLAAAYAALVGDGRLRSPRVGWALVRPDGTKVKEIEVPVVGRLPLSAGERAYIKGALSEVASDGTAAGAFSGFPMDEVKIGGKTGTAEVYGKADTSWFASFAPTDKPRFVIVAMVSQGGMGGQTAAPAVRKIYEAIFGFAPDGKRTAPLLPGGRPAAEPPMIERDGTVAR